MKPEEAISKTQKELKENESKWVSRFEKYITKSAENVDSIIEKRIVNIIIK